MIDDPMAVDAAMERLVRKSQAVARARETASREQTAAVVAELRPERGPDERADLTDLVMRTDAFEDKAINDVYVKVVLGLRELDAEGVTL